MEGLSDDMFESFVGALRKDKEVSSWYLGSAGALLGQRGLGQLVEEKGITDIIAEQKKKYVSAVAGTLAMITEESVTAHQDDDQDETADGPDGPDSVLGPLISGRSSADVQAAASSLGYIPTVAGISASMPPQGYSNTGDEQLGRTLSGLAKFLSTDENRFLFCTASSPAGRSTTVLAGLLDKDVGLPVQVYYQAVFCLWLLSFVSQQDSSSDVTETVSKALEEAAVPRRLTHVLREVWAEKVVRISLATLRNILKMSVTLRKEMVGAGLVSALQSLCFRRWNDEDIREDLGVLADALESELASMSNFDVYRAEVLSGALEWTPAHRDELFWQENVEKLERNQQEVLRCMVRLLHESTDDTVLAVACNDIAMFIKCHPRGRAIAQSLGVKARLMELMVSGEGDVRRYALNCVQVLMIRWNRQES